MNNDNINVQGTVTGRIQAGSVLRDDSETNLAKLNMAINNLSSLVAHAEDILAKIKVTGTDPQQKISSPPPRSLQNLLETGGFAINDVTQRVHELLNEIDDILFH